MSADSPVTTERHDQPAWARCPICDAAASLHGHQPYPVTAGSLPSWIFRCGACDFNFRRFGRPLAEVVSHFQVASYTTPTDEDHWRKRRERFYEFLLDLLNEPAQGRALLDVGCAFAHFLDRAVNRGYRPFGTEVSTEMAELLRRRRNYPVSTRPLHDLQLPEGRFDVISFVDSFYYFEDPLATLRQCRKLLRPGGQLLMRITNRNSLARLYRLGRKLLLRRDPVPALPHATTDDAISCHSRRSLSIAMDRAGLHVRRMTCLEPGAEKFDWLLPRTFHYATNLMARLTFQRVCLTPGIVCVGTAD